MNNNQEIASLISGHSLYEGEASTKDDGYYELETYAEKLVYVMELSESFEGFEPLTLYDAHRIVEYLDSEFNSANDWFHKMRAL